MNLNDNLSKNFRLIEFLRSKTADYDDDLRNIQYNPPWFIIRNLKRLSVVTLQPLRDELCVEIYITSGWRCNELNIKIGGALTSQHPQGNAADAHVKKFSMRAYTEVSECARAFGLELRSDVSSNFLFFAYAAIHRDRLDIDQVIHEFGEPGCPKYIHVSSSNEKNKREIRIINRRENRVLSLEEAISLGCK